MEIGKPRRVYTVEPVEKPVPLPERAPPPLKPTPEPREPSKQ